MASTTKAGTASTGGGGWQTVYAPDLAALAAADWKAVGGTFSVDGVDWTTRNHGTFSAGALGPDGSAGVRLKPSSSGNWWDATTTAGGVDFLLTDACAAGGVTLTAETPIRVVTGWRIDSAPDAAYDQFGVALIGADLTTAPRGVYVDNSFEVGAALVQSVRRTGAAQAVFKTSVAARPGLGLWKSGETARAWTHGTAPTSVPDAGWTGWTATASPWAIDDRAINTAAALDPATMRVFLAAYLAGAAVGLDATLTYLAVQALT